MKLDITPHEKLKICSMLGIKPEKFLIMLVSATCWFTKFFLKNLQPQTSRLPTCAGDAYFQRSQAQCNTNSAPVGTSEGGQEIWRGALR